MRKETIRDMQQHAAREYPRECCGVVASDEEEERYFPCRNMATGNGSFMLDPRDRAEAEDWGVVMAIVHSHPDDALGPTDSDRAACERSGLPWIILEVHHNGQTPVVTRTYRISPKGFRAPLIGRPFFHGVLDCYSIIQDWFSRERSIALPDFDRPDDWWKGQSELYLDGFAEAGFEKVASGADVHDGWQPKVGDVILMQHRSERVNHGAVYLGDSELKEHPGLHRMAGMMLHHLYGRPSQREVYGGYWQEITRLVVRHKDQK